MNKDYLIRQINRYDVSYYAWGKAEGLRYQVMIDLRNTQDKLIGVTYFHPDVEVESPAVSKTGNGLIVVHFPVSTFSRIIDLLRNEKPVYLRHREGEPFVAAIDTTSEPIGEGNE